MSAGTWAMPSTSTIRTRTPAHGYAGDEQAHADDDRLDEGNADDALGHGTDGRRGQFRELRAMLRADQSIEDGTSATVARLPEGHENAGDDEGGQEHQQAAPDAGDEAESRLGNVTDLRLHALDERGKIVVRPRP